MMRARGLDVVLLSLLLGCSSWGVTPDVPDAPPAAGTPPATIVLRRERLDPRLVEVMERFGAPYGGIESLYANSAVVHGSEYAWKRAADPYTVTASVRPGDNVAVRFDAVWKSNPALKGNDRYIFGGLGSIRLEAGYTYFIDVKYGVVFPDYTTCTLSCLEARAGVTEAGATPCRPGVVTPTPR